MSSNIFNGNGVFDSQTVALAFYSGLVDEHSTISCESWVIQIAGQLIKTNVSTPTGKGKTNVIVKHDNFSNGSRILKLQDRFLLDAQDNYILSSNPNLATD